tara:strand:- start:777 stop:1202 length:426 start_codon:yes stop_codon:yes gene_type:complete
MKNFKNFVSESMIGTSHQNQAIDNNTNMSALSNPEVLRKLNAWVGTIAGSYVLPEDAVSKLRSSLMKIGLTFDEVSMMEGSGTVELPLTLFGGRFGKDLDTPHNEFVKDDGLSHMIEGGLTLVIGYEMQEDNSTRLTAKIN